MSSRTGAAGEDDRRLLRRAAREVAVLIAVAVAVVLTTAGAGVVLVGDARESAAARETARAAWESADDVGDPPPGTWLVVAGPEGIEVTPGAPGAVARVDPHAWPDGPSELGSETGGFAVWTGDRAVGRVSALYDLRPLELREQRVRNSVLVSVILGAAGAAGVGSLVGRRAVRPLGDALLLQRRFVADASHELRTPLTVVSTRAQLLRRSVGERLDPDAREELDQLIRDAKAMADVVDDLLLAAQLESTHPGDAEVDLVLLTQEVVTSLRPLAHELGLLLRLVTQEGAAPLVVTGSGAALRRALTALVDNALRHGPPGSEVLLEVIADPAGRGRTVRLVVQDSGEGMDPEDLVPLRERFARGTVEGEGSRFGLGLSLVDKVARTHGGDLSVARRSTGGAAFTLSLPLSRRD